MKKMIAAFFLVLPLVLTGVSAEKMYELDESINLTDLKDKLELFKRTRQVVDEHMGGINNLHSKHKKNDPSLAGQVIVKLILNKKGEVDKAKVVKSQLTSKEFLFELVSSVKKWKFGKLSKDGQEILIPFFFK